MTKSAADYSRLRCPRCRSGELAISDNEVLCTACGAHYPAEDGVAVLVADPVAHESDIARARQVNPGWYLEEQPAEAVSPWRHHLKKRRLYVQDLLARELARRGRTKAEALLDLGCGDGTHMVWLSAFAEQLYGSDYNAVRLVRARKQMADATLFLADILDYPAKDNAFDVVFFNHVIEHIPDDMAALETIHRILKPGGLLVLGTPNEGAWWWQWAYRRAPDVLATTDHVHFYTAEVLTERMRAAGFTVSEVKHMGWGPPDWRLDGQLRRHKVLDDLFEAVGRVVLPKQASSLYVVATK
ncbi:hypothetical protein GCM10011321_33190 [Youhaiella tibetensis]|uniref:Methyltransferase domain-containing protein n=1 Tax=Paradevosia tibetensis TaxID=1447062 RepID=A0A5B9DI63_9HYPH|nr:methyltransferase domain-containing protein [Youhaiella tibetensis]AKR57787.1 hypothetical protein XM25_18760 [Devosia sp. H5989]QEE18736.1 methyltransferase domain-containing protein [Youhaiella tibetensis]GGF39711.1 hypothetical protein GCM10011321_33190 [Youhaiella tibetensis]